MMVGYSSISALAVASFFMQRRPRQAPDMYHFFRFLTNFVTVEGCTMVELSTRMAFLNIDQSLQFRIFWSQSMIRCMLSAGSGSKMFGALKVTICVNFFELSVHKMSNFLRISACQWTIPSGLFATKNHSKFFCSC